MITAAVNAGERERRLDLFGTSVRIHVTDAGRLGDPRAEIAAAAAQAALVRHQHALSRFDPRSELSALNRDPRASRRVSDLTAAAIGAALWAARWSSGLVDPTLLCPPSSAPATSTPVPAPSRLRCARLWRQRRRAGPRARA